MNAEALAAAKAYLNTARPEQSDSISGAAQAPASFGQMVTEALDAAVQSGRETESKIAGVIEGKGDMVDVVTAVAETELAMESMVAVRDRVISAYQEIMNMPI